MEGARVLVTGGSGYVGQFAAARLAALGADVALTYHSGGAAADGRALEAALHGCRAFRADLRSGDGLADVRDAFGAPDVVVNCAAISAPRACEADPEAAQAVNVPRELLRWLAAGAPGGGKASPLLIHLSTDQVYDGSKGFYKETDEAKPINEYGRSKVRAEELIAGSWPNYAILRSSIIVGPQPPVPLARGLPLLWMDSTLASGQPTDFFNDEVRCPVYVMDVVHAVEILAKSAITGHESFKDIFNLGGPDRLSRVEMAEEVARVRGYDLQLIKSVPAASVNRGVKSPLDISMDVTNIRTRLELPLTSFKDAVLKTFQL
eukprot:SM000071S21083  [mRNA]  locus=s71:320104:322126:+ [translate_table: standard]